MKEGYDKEKVYDEKIAPLMHEILQICKAEQIPMIADFYLKSEDMAAEDMEGTMHCTSYIRPEDNTPDFYPDIISRIYNRGERPFVMAMTVTQGGKP